MTGMLRLTMIGLIGLYDWLGTFNNVLFDLADDYWLDWTDDDRSDNDSFESTDIWLHGRWLVSLDYI